MNVLEAQTGLLDGEAVGDVYHAFDLLERDGMDLRPSPYAVRYDNLLNLIDAVPSNQFLYVPAAVGTARKRAMLERLRRAAAAGEQRGRRLQRPPGSLHPRPPGQRRHPAQAEVLFDGIVPRRGGEREQAQRVARPVRRRPPVMPGLAA